MVKRICLPNEENPSIVILRDEDDEGYVVEQHHDGKVYGMFDLSDEEAKMLAVGMFGAVLEPK